MTTGGSALPDTPQGFVEFGALAAAASDVVSCDPRAGQSPGACVHLVLGIAESRCPRVLPYGRKTEQIPDV